MRNGERERIEWLEGGEIGDIVSHIQTDRAFGNISNIRWKWLMGRDMSRLALESGGKSDHSEYNIFE